MSIRQIAIGAPFSMARIGSTMPLPTVRLVEPPATCCAIAVDDGANTGSILMPTASKKPFWMPI